MTVTTSHHVDNSTTTYNENALTHKRHKSQQPQTIPAQEFITRINRAVIRRDIEAALHYTTTHLTSLDTPLATTLLTEGICVALYKTYLVLASGRDVHDMLALVFQLLHLIYSNLDKQTLRRHCQELGEEITRAILVCVNMCLDNYRSEALLRACLANLLLLDMNTTNLSNSLVRVANSDEFEEELKGMALQILAKLDNKGHKRSPSSSCDELLLHTFTENLDADNLIIRENAAAGLSKLTCNSNHVQELMQTLQDPLLSKLVPLMTDATTSLDAVSILKNISLSYASLVVMWRGGELVTGLCHVLHEDKSIESRKIASQTLCHVTTNDTSHLMASHDNLLRTIEGALLGDASEDVRASCARLLKQLSYNIHSHNEAYDSFLHTLLAVLLSDYGSSEQVTSVSKALLQQTTHESNRQPILKELTLLTSGLMKLLMSHHQYATVASILRNLSLESCEDTKRKLVLSSEVLDMLGLTLQHCTGVTSGTSRIDSAKHSLKTIANLSSTELNKKHLANYFGLVEALLEVCRDKNGHVPQTVRVWARNSLQNLTPYIGET